MNVQDVRATLATVLDPEMPINIVDLGIVTDVRVHSDNQACTAHDADAPSVSHGSAPAIQNPKSKIQNPEACRVEVDITPTFIGCPALDVLREEIEWKLRTLGATDIRVRFVNDPPWSVERITDAGREALRKHGVTVPQRGSLQKTVGPDGSPIVPLTIGGSPAFAACPYCGSDQTHMESQFGPTRCRMIYYCDACRNQFEHMKPV
ncbi:MAG: 1,2-phenylacetyl-CoA epoxidase subunit PaaD [Phycisphaerae bacterium]